MRTYGLIFMMLLAYAGAGAQPSRPLIEPKPAFADQPAAGKMASVTEPEYAGTQIRHCVYLPVNYDSKKKWPLIVELPGNKWKFGSGEVEEAHLGYAATLGKDFIWVVLPCVDVKNRTHAVTWWGDADSSAEYARMVIPRIIKQYGGDPDKVILCGFSRGSIGVSFIGLHDEETAKLWTAFFTHDHFDGQREWKGTDWGSPIEEYRAEAAQRLARAAGREWYVSFNGTTEGRRFTGPLKAMGVETAARFIYAPVPIAERFPDIPNEYISNPHNDLWPLFDIEESRLLREWLYKTAGVKR